MEDSPLFNAGKGSFLAEGQNELEASIMEGSTRLAGAGCRRHNGSQSDPAAHAVMTKARIRC